jgi:transposase-like protein
MKCPHCAQTEGQVKVGRNTSRSQRYWYKACGHKYTPEPTPHVYNEAVRQQALRLYVDGMNLRRIGRTLGISYQSVANWVAAYAAQLPDVPPIPAATVAVAELDEGYTFVGEKKNGSTSSRK